MFVTETSKDWSEFNGLEAEFVQLLNNASVIEVNFSTQSQELAQLLLAIGKQVNIVAKQLCRSIDPDSSVMDIAQYATLIVNEYPSITELTVQLSRFDASFNPWKNWKPGNAPNWWRCYSNLKYKRCSEASVESVASALAGLYALNSFLNKDYFFMGSAYPLSESPYIAR